MLALAFLLLGGAALAQDLDGQPTPHGFVQQAARDAALAFLAPHGVENFPPHYVEALQSLLGAREQYWSGDFAGAHATLAALWKKYPAGDSSWGALPTQPFGINLGSPPCYYELRILSDVASWRIARPKSASASRSARLTVLLIGKSHGVEPRNMAELTQGTGVEVEHTLDERVARDGYRVVHRSLRTFNEYVLAMTRGRLSVETRVLPLPNVDLAVHATASSGRKLAGLVDASRAFASVPPAEVAATDWWWLIYPSHVPEQHPDFAEAEFITGGMGVGPDSHSPLFLIDDRWLLRKPPHLGSGECSDIEREAYLPQWLQHEFFHHLFRAYPQFELEASDHQWFDRGAWPKDFEGRYEADYYHEALVKRLHAAKPGLHAGLRYSTAGAPWGKLTVKQLLGRYQRSPRENDWHTAEIRSVGGQLQWRNQAGVSWKLEAELRDGFLATGPDCPYYDSPGAQRMSIVLERDEAGDLTARIRGIAFNGELFARE